MNSERQKRYFDTHAPQREKIRLIFLPFMLLSIITILLCSFVYWYLVCEKGMDKYWVGLVTVIVACLPMILLTRRLHLIEKNIDGKKGRGLLLLCTMTTFLPLLFLQTTIDRSVGRLTTLDDLTEMATTPPTRFYTVKRPVRIADSILQFTEIIPIHHRYASREEELRTYCVTPLYSESRSAQFGWIGKVYQSRSFPPAQTPQNLNSFIPTAVERFRAEAGQPFTYLERITLNKESGYYRALGLSGIHSPELTVLIPHTGPFAQRAGHNLQAALLVYVIGAGLFLIIVLASAWNEQRLHCFLTGERYRDTIAAKPSNVVKGTKVANDKLIVVQNITRQKIERDLAEVCKVYNGDGGQIYPKLQQLGETKFAITFPYDIDFDAFCYLINYLCYPVSGGVRAEVTGWTGDSLWLTEAFWGKELMLYVPVEDTKHDNVYVTAEDGTCCKFDFGGAGRTIPLTEPCRPYQIPEDLKITNS